MTSGRASSCQRTGGGALAPPFSRSKEQISFLKRAFGLERCTWRSFESFKADVQASVLSCNLLVIARKLLAST